MGRKGLCIGGGVVVLVGTFLFGWIIGTFDQVGFLSVLNITNLFSPINLYNIIVLILFICILISGAMILVGIKAGGLAIAFGIIDVLFAAFVFIDAYITVPVISDITNTFYVNLTTSYQIFGLIPLHIYLPIFHLGSIGLGTLLILIGGILAIVGGASSKD
jgi:hypothetical protein